MSILNSVIDWSKAPEGATHYCADQEFDGVEYGAHWLKSGYYWLRGGTCWLKDTSRVPDGALVCRPVELWNGAGLPPVGVVCELRTKVGGWGEAEIKYHGPAICVWLWVRRDGNTAQIEFAENPERLEFRPIRTPWQIAAKEREAAAIDIKRAVEAGPYTRYGISHDAALAIYDAGYRKTEGAK